MKRIFNFYLDDDLKYAVNSKLIRLNGKENKGQLAALIRTLLRQFAMVPDELTDKKLLDACKAEYELSTKLNKRSSM